VWGGKSRYTLDDLNAPPPKPPGLTSRVINKFKTEGVSGILTAVKNNIGGGHSITGPKTHADHHTFCWTYDNTIDLLKKTGFRIEKEHWQKKPYDMCVYISAVKD
jgi:hypothetical protein